jgi:O-acetyl-ADP-ribose deacetylase (regulator of RNase III)
MEIVFFDPDAAFCEAMTRYLELDKIAGATVVQSELAALDSFDCLVGGVNSFGLMSVGHDLAAAAQFGPTLQARVQAAILDEYLGEQPVGTALLVETGRADGPYFVHAPIMRVTMRVAFSDHVYCALYAALLAVRRHNRAAANAPADSARQIQRVAVPSLGTGEGGLPPAQSARQMALAYKNITHPPDHISWHMANNRQQEIRYGGDDGVHFPPEWA